MLPELRPGREPVGTRGHQLGIGERERFNRGCGAGMKLANLRERPAVPGANREAQALGFLAKMLERRIVRQRTDWHSDLLARTTRA